MSLQGFPITSWFTQPAAGFQPGPAISGEPRRLRHGQGDGPGR
jgi:hypothetical protein